MYWKWWILCVQLRTRAALGGRRWAADVRILQLVYHLWNGALQGFSALFQANQAPACITVYTIHPSGQSSSGMYYRIFGSILWCVYVGRCRCSGREVGSSRFYIAAMSTVGTRSTGDLTVLYRKTKNSCWQTQILMISYWKMMISYWKMLIFLIYTRINSHIPDHMRNPSGREREFLRFTLHFAPFDSIIFYFCSILLHIYSICCCIFPWLLRCSSPLLGSDRSDVPNKSHNLPLILGLSYAYIFPRSRYICALVLVEIFSPKPHAIDWLCELQ